MTLVCCNCRKPRSNGSGKLCRLCYRSRAAARKENSPVGKVLNAMIELERRGNAHQAPFDHWQCGPWRPEHGIAE